MPTQFAAALRALRANRGLSQSQLARQSGVSVHCIHKIERGETPWPRWNTVCLLANALEVSTDVFNFWKHKCHEDQSLTSTGDGIAPAPADDHTSD